MKMHYCLSLILINLYFTFEYFPLRYYLMSFGWFKRIAILTWMGCCELKELALVAGIFANSHFFYRTALFCPCCFRNFFCFWRRFKFIELDHIFMIMIKESSLHFIINIVFLHRQTSQIQVSYGRKSWCWPTIRSIQLGTLKNRNFTMQTWNIEIEPQKKVKLSLRIMLQAIYDEQGRIMLLVEYT